MSNRFRELQALKGTHAWTGIPLGSLPAYLAVDSAGHPALVVPAEGPGWGQPLETDYLSLRPFVRASITVQDNTLAGHFHILSCKKSSDDILGPFETVATALAEELTGTENADTRLTDTFHSLCDLFRMQPERDVSSARIGLWGELFVMRETDWYSGLAPFWHTETNRKYDFSSRNARLEVKSTTGEQRVHTFAHGQLVTPGGASIVIASLLLRPEEAGLSLHQMVTEARSALTGQTEHLIKLEKAVRAVGLAEDNDAGPSFDDEEARANLRYYLASDVPHFPMPEPPGVSGTTYQAHLGGAIAMTPDAVGRWVEMFRDGSVD